MFRQWTETLRQRLMKTALQLVGLFALVGLLAAIELLEDAATIALFIALWLCPLILPTLNVVVFWKIARAAEIPLSFITGTVIVIAALSTAGIGLLNDQALLYWAIAAMALGFYSFALLRISGLSRLAAAF